MYFAIAFLIVSYLLLVISCYTFWLSHKNSNFDEVPEYPALSILCVGRNEQAHLDELLNSVCKINYPGHWEFIYVDDHSSDETFLKVQPFLSDYISYLKPNTSVTGKKRCQALGVEKSTGDWVLCIDADCSFEPEWPKTMVQFALAHQKMWVGGVVVQKEDSNRSFLNNWQKVETLFLNIIGGVFLSFGLPILANGANMLFKKDVFKPMNDNQLLNPSGDDVLLTQQVSKMFGKEKLGFCFDSISKVSTDSPSEWNLFLNQKIRWASKFKIYSCWEAKLFLVYFSIVQISWVFLFFLELKLWILLTILKLLIEITTFSHMAKRYQVKQNLLFSLITNVLYPYYSLAIGTMARWKGFEWKNRTYLIR
ncbi:MAG: glycosyltransferase [Cytophagales bacterium]